MRVLCNILCLYKWKFYKRAVIEFSFLRYDNEAHKKVERERVIQGPNTCLETELYFVIVWKWLAVGGFV